VEVKLVGSILNKKTFNPTLKRRHWPPLLFRSHYRPK